MPGQRSDLHYSNERLRIQVFRHFCFHLKFGKHLFALISYIWSTSQELRLSLLLIVLRKQLSILFVQPLNIEETRYLLFERKYSLMQAVDALTSFDANLLHVNYATAPGNYLQLNLYALLNIQSSRQLLLPLPSEKYISLSLHLVCALKPHIYSSLLRPSFIFPLSAVLIIHPCNYTQNQHQNGDMRTSHNKDVMNTQIFRSETFYFKSLAHKCQRKALTFGFMKRTLMPSCGQ